MSKECVHFFGPLCILWSIYIYIYIYGLYIYIYIYLNHAVYEIMKKNSVEGDRPQMTLWHMHIALLLTKLFKSKTFRCILVLKVKTKKF